MKTEILTTTAVLYANRKIYTYNQPLPKSTSSKISALQAGPVGLNVAILTLFGIGFLQASFAVFIVAVSDYVLFNPFIESTCIAFLY